MGLPNSVVIEHMNALFGIERADNLRIRLEKLSPEDRELAIINELSLALLDQGGKYILPFTFKNEKGTRTSHHLIFVTKHFRGYDIMKGIMARHSSSVSQGVPSFEFCLGDERYPLLFELSRPLDDLKALLLNDFAGMTISMKQIYEKHSVGKPYIDRNYKDVLIELEKEGEIATDPPAKNRKFIKGKLSFGPNVQVTFPKKILN
jgi:hypothetical protein